MEDLSANNGLAMGLVAVASISLNTPVEGKAPERMKLTLTIPDDAAFFEQVDAQLAEIAEDSDAWEEELQERRAWDETLGDGLSTEP